MIFLLLVICAPLPFAPWLPDPVGEYKYVWKDLSTGLAEENVAFVTIRRDGTAAHRYASGDARPYPDLRWTLNKDGSVTLWQEGTGIGRYWLDTDKRCCPYRVRRLR